MGFSVYRAAAHGDEEHGRSDSDVPLVVADELAPPDYPAKGARRLIAFPRCAEWCYKVTTIRDL
jgi:hypothetical protein